MRPEFRFMWPSSIFFLPVIVSLAALVSLFGLASPASAEPNSVPDETWVTDGRVTSMVKAGDRVYLGGSFRYVGPNTGYGVALNPDDGQRDTTFPRVNGKIVCAVSDGAGGWYIGGNFSNVGTLFRDRLAHILANGKVANWNPKPNNTVNALALSADGSRLYVGGGFTSVGGAARNNLAVIDTTTGAVDASWNPKPNNTVNALALSADGSRLYTGGGFTSMGGTTRNRLAAVDATTGAVDASWNPNSDNTVNALALSADGSRLYTGGGFTSMGGMTRNRLAAVDATTGAVDASWNPNSDNTVNALALSADGSRLYTGGGFTSMGGTTRNRLAAVDATTGAVDASWNPNANASVNALALSADGSRLYTGGGFTSMGGMTRNRLAAVDATTGAVDASWNPNSDNTVNALALSSNGTRLFAGGGFVSVGGMTRNRLAAVDATTGAVDASWNPDANNTVDTLALSADGTRLFAGGTFTTMGGLNRQRLAAIDVATGAVDRRWDPWTNSTVRSLAVSGSRVYVGGEFTTVKGQSRTRLALVDAATGNLDASWIPTADNTVRTLKLSRDGSQVYVGGFFTQISGSGSYRRLARLDATTGSADASWRPNPGFPVYDMSVTNGRVYAAGAGIGGTLTAFDANATLATGNFTWSLSGDGDFQAVMARGDKVYVGGHFDVIGGQTRNRVAAVDAATGAVDPGWTPAIPGQDTMDLGVWTMTGASGPRLYMGGDFVKVAGQAQRGLAIFPDSDATPPTVGSVTPQDGAKEVATTINVEATFSEAMDSSTLDGSTFTLTKQGTATTVAAKVSYDELARKATLDPNSDLEEGTYTATVKGGTKDVAGNQLGIDKTWSFSTPDTTPPETSVDSGPSGTVNSTAATFAFSSSEASSTFECSLDGAAFEVCSSPKDYTGLSDGSHTFRVQATDASGITDPTPAERTFTVDSLAPDAPVISSPAENSLQPATFTLSGTAVPSATVEVFEGTVSQGTTQADVSGAWSKALSGVTDGSHTYTAKATNEVGNTSSASNARTVIVDTTSPETSMSSGPSGTVNSTSATFAFSSSEASSTFECSLDGAAFEVCSSPKDYTGLSDGSHTFRVQATDASGITDPTPAERTFTVDATAPSVQPPDRSFTLWSALSATGTIPVNLSWSATDAQSGISQYQLQQSINGGTYTNSSLSSATATSKSVSLSGGNAYNFRVRAMDSADNWSDWSAGPEFVVDAHQEDSGAIGYVGGWTQEAASTAYGGRLAYAQSSGSRATFTFTGRDFAWVSTQNVDRGKAEVWVDGVKMKTVDLYYASSLPRKVVYTQSWASSETHTVEIRALGTKNASSSGTRVDVDAFVVLR